MLHFANYQLKNVQDMVTFKVVKALLKELEEESTDSSVSTRTLHCHDINAVGEQTMVFLYVVLEYVDHVVLTWRSHNLTVN